MAKDILAHLSWRRIKLHTWRHSHTHRHTRTHTHGTNVTSKSYLHNYSIKMDKLLFRWVRPLLYVLWLIFVFCHIFFSWFSSFAPFDCFRAFFLDFLSFTRSLNPPFSRCLALFDRLLAFFFTVTPVLRYFASIFHSPRLISADRPLQRTKKNYLLLSYEKWVCKWECQYYPFQINSK